MGMVRTTLLVGADGVIERIWSKVKVKGHAQEVWKR
jgi:peroxiredoxin Q/BCP